MPWWSSWSRSTTDPCPRAWPVYPEPEQEIVIATSAYLLAREAAVVAARTAVKDLSEALHQERYCEDGRVYPEHADQWGSTYAHLVALRRDLARLVAELGPEVAQKK